jgi:Rrf2 family transcriptional regulator, iron-sulfur cluster assembly transcription factor
MRLTRAGEYAVRCVLYLSSSPREEIVSRKAIAEAMDIPEQFLGKIAQQLARSGIVEIVQGARGGFRLLRSPDDLSLLEVVEATIGEIFLNDCLMNPGICMRSAACAVNKIWEKARDELRETLAKATFKRLLESQSCMSPSLPSRSKTKAAPRAMKMTKKVSLSRKGG